MDFVKVIIRNLFYIKVFCVLAGVAQWIERGLRVKGSLVQFPVRAHAWVVGRVPRGVATTH